MKNTKIIFLLLIPILVFSQSKFNASTESALKSIFTISALLQNQEIEKFQEFTKDFEVKANGTESDWNRNGIRSDYFYSNPLDSYYFMFQLIDLDSESINLRFYYGGETFTLDNFANNNAGYPNFDAAYAEFSEMIKLLNPGWVKMLFDIPDPEGVFEIIDSQTKKEKHSGKIYKLSRTSSFKGADFEYDDNGIAKGMSLNLMHDIGSNACNPSKACILLEMLIEIRENSGRYTIAFLIGIDKSYSPNGTFEIESFFNKKLDEY